MTIRNPIQSSAGAPKIGSVHGVGSLSPRVHLPPGISRLGEALPKTAAMFRRVHAGGRGLILINSDSTSCGYNVTNMANGSRRSLAAAMARGLRRFGVHAHANGFCGDQAVTAANISAHNPNLTLGSGVTTAYANSLGVNYFQLSGAGALSWAGTEPFDTVFIDYITTNVAGGDLTVDIGGSVLATLASQQASNYYTSGPISLGAPSTYTVNVKRAGGATQPGNVVSVRCYNSANPGVLVMCVGGNGKNTSDLIGTGTYGFPKGYALLLPDLIICGEQINDWTVGGANVPVATHATRIATMISQSKNAGASDALMLDGPRSRSSISPLATQDEYHASDIASALAASVPMLSFWDSLGPNDGSTAQNLTYYDVTGHLTDEAYGAYGFGLANAIGSEFA